MAADREPEHAAGLAARALGMVAGDGCAVLPVVTRATAVHSALRPWDRTQAVRKLAGQLDDLGRTEGLNP
jgi:hypothetical protein